MAQHGWILIERDVIEIGAHSGDGNGIDASQLQRNQFDVDRRGLPWGGDEGHGWINPPDDGIGVADALNASAAEIERPERNSLE